MKNKTIKILFILLVAIIQTISLAAQNTYTYGYDAAGNRNQLNSPISCLELDCPCPENTDGWLVFEAIPQEPPSTDCDITAHLNIPEEYSDCYSFFEVVAWGYESFTTQKQLLSSLDNNMISDLQMSMPSPRKQYAQVFLYRHITDQNPCIIESEVECIPDCCGLIHLDFIKQEPQGSQCCWTFYVNGYDEDACDTDFQLKIETVVEEGETPQEIVNIPAIQGFGDFCIENTETEVRMIILDEGTECRNEIVKLECDKCPCPPQYEMDGWLHLTIDQDGSQCSPTQCEVSAVFDIPELYKDCYNFYEIEYVLRDIGASPFDHEDPMLAPGVIPADGVVTNLPTCIDPGKSIVLKVRLYNAVGDADYCEFVVMEQACPLFVVEDREPCTPDNFNDGWEDPMTILVNVNGCWYQVSFKYRLTSDGHQDIQFISSHPANPNCTAEKSEVFNAALDPAIEAILDANDDYKPQNGGCYDSWRVIEATCWSKWEAIYFLGETTHNTVIDVPCESDCCTQEIRVCKYNFKVSTQVIGYADNNNTDCSTALLPDDARFILPYDAIITILEPCSPNDCNMFQGHESNTGRPTGTEVDYDALKDEAIKAEGGYQMKEMLANFAELQMIYQIYQKQNTLAIKIAQAKEQTVEFKIYNSIGQELQSISLNLSGYNQEFEIDISTLISGSYFYSIISGTNKLNSGKFIIVK